MRPKTLITQWVHPEIIDFLSPVTDVTANMERQAWPREYLLEQARDARSVMVFMPDMVDEAFLLACPDLKLISAALKGYDNFDVAACTRRGVWFSMVPDLLTIPTAELAIGLLIGLSRNVRPGDRQVRSGDFKGWRPVLYGQGLDQSVAGIIGMGAVGQAITGMLSGFNTRVIYNDIRPIPENTFTGMAPKAVSLDRLFSEADFILVATPFSEATRHIINTRALERIRPQAIIVNIGRGSCVDEAAVARALDEGRLAGYAADVFEFEDWARPDRPDRIPDALRTSAKTLFTPHLGSAVDRVRYNIAMEAAVSIRDYFEGRTPRGAVNRI